MKKIIPIGFGSVLIVAGASAALFGAGTAGAATDVVGDTYSDAAKAISDDGGTARIAARVGDTLSQDDCIVTNQSTGSFLRIDTPASNEVMLALNCAGAYATASSPGLSIASPEGRAAKDKADEEAAEEQQKEEAAAEDSKPK